MRHRNLLLASAVVGGLSLAGAVALMPAHDARAQQQQPNHSQEIAPTERAFDLAKEKRQLSYSQDIAPIFRGWCVSCHQPGGEGYERSGLDLRTYQGLMKGTKFGPMIIPGQPDISNLIVLIDGRASPTIRMPYKHKPLPDCLRQNIWTWIFQGAKDN